MLREQAEPPLPRAPPEILAESLISSSSEKSEGTRQRSSKDLRQSYKQKKSSGSAATEDGGSSDNMAVLQLKSIGASSFISPFSMPNKNKVSPSAQIGISGKFLTLWLFIIIEGEKPSLVHN